MQDNSPYNTANSVKTFHSEYDVTFMARQAQNPDINPIEIIWKLQKERKRIEETSKNYRII